ncbi:MAG TPA: helix-turn-helix domain-containing protein [Mycobacteriales bacterium]|nr:helix-turn-helix domain-containing protein [Mycobacteriales bacterium]
MSEVMRAVSEPAPAPTLRALIERLQPAVVEVVAAPRGLDVAVSDPVLLDPAEPLSAGADAIVLALGVDSDRGRVAVVRQAADARAAAVVVKLPGEVGSELRAAAEDAGVAVLAAPPELAWGHLYTLLLTASVRTTPEAAGLSEAPLGDLFALANAVAAVVGGATTIEDPSNHVLAYSNLEHPIDAARQATILGRQVPSDWIQRLHDSGVFRRLWQTDEVVRIADFIGDEVEYLPRIAIAVRAGGELLGSLWVIEGRQELGAEAEQTLRDASRIASLHLLRHRTAADAERLQRSRALLALLDGSDDGGMAAGVLGLATDRPMSVVAFDVGADADASGAIAASRVADLVAVYCESYRREAHCAATGSRVYALIAVDEGDGTQAGETIAATIVERAGNALRLQLRAGIGSTVSGAAAIAASRREADEVLDVLRYGGERRTATIEAVRAQVFLRRLRELATRSPDLLVGQVAALSEQDAAKGTAWVPTLRAYFDAYGDMATAAAAVNVHPNTFRYRLRRISEVFGLDLTDPDTRLVAELQLRFLDPA